ncbi:hypothetical protein PJI17_31530, partial [Mycobacterium kansasii]
KEVKGAIDELEGDKAPGPDGFPIIFFQTFWDILKGDLLEFIAEFHDRAKNKEKTMKAFRIMILLLFFFVYLRQP